MLNEVVSYIEQCEPSASLNPLYINRHSPRPPCFPPSSLRTRASFYVCLLPPNRRVPFLSTLYPTDLAIMDLPSSVSLSSLLAAIPPQGSQQPLLPHEEGMIIRAHHGVPNNLYRRHLSCDLRVNAATLITQPLLLFVVQMPSDKADRTINRSSLYLAARSTYSRTVFMIYT